MRSDRWSMWPKVDADWSALVHATKPSEATVCRACGSPVASAARPITQVVLYRTVGAYTASHGEVAPSERPSQVEEAVSPMRRPTEDRSTGQARWKPEYVGDTPYHEVLRDRLWRSVALATGGGSREELVLLDGKIVSYNRESSPPRQPSIGASKLTRSAKEMARSDNREVVSESSSKAKRGFLRVGLGNSEDILWGEPITTRIRWEVGDVITVVAVARPAPREIVVRLNDNFILARSVTGEFPFPDGEGMDLIPKQRVSCTTTDLRDGAPSTPGRTLQRAFTVGSELPGMPSALPRRSHSVVMVALALLMMELLLPSAMAAFMRRKKKLNDRKVKSAHLPDSVGKQVQLVAVNRMDLYDEPPAAAAATALEDEGDGPPPSTLTPNNNVDGDHSPGGYSSVISGRKVNTSDPDSPFRFTFVANSRTLNRPGVETLSHEDLLEDVLPELGVGPYPAQGLPFGKVGPISCENELEAIRYIIARKNQFYAADFSQENGIKNEGCLVPWAIGSLLLHRDFVGQFTEKKESEVKITSGNPEAGSHLQDPVCKISESFTYDDGSQSGVAVEAAWSGQKGRFEISSFIATDEQGTSTRANSDKIERLNSLIWGTPAAHQRPLLVLNLRNEGTATDEINRSLDGGHRAPSRCRRYLRYVALVLKHIEGVAKYLPESATTHGGDEGVPAVIHAYVTASENVGKKKGGSEEENTAF
ncbi:hypothetical protein FOZ60_000875 [Perkinsus olseni]|uniref:Uncharacterized protein n=1 Tax=Perkinsus olseni TaxID=32597 RepID=A0A7J6PJV9_PEROL|nr:hypothetical protein FOZ60_000875 [Perkinsus olseni]